LTFIYRAIWTAAIAFSFTLAAAAADGMLRAGPLCKSPGQKLDEQGFVLIGGIEQWVTIKGEDCRNPVILMLHGGPGNPMSPYSAEIFGPWEKSFMIVQWDQRGTGRTFGRNPGSADSTLTIKQMTSDGTELAGQLASRLGKKNVILVGGSWGSILGVHMIKSKPQLFAAYVGVSQLVSYQDNMSASYAKTLAAARAAGDQTTVSALAAMGPPPWSNPRNFGTLRRALRPYEAKVSTPPPKEWWVPAPGYDSPAATADTEAGEEYSFLQFVGLKGDGMYSAVDLPKLGLTFEAPMYFVHGAHDLVATPDVARAYFDQITSPDKAFVQVPKAGHDPNVDLVNAQFDILTERVQPLAR
jgi:pimeloyl-ACP methyl ester carboxylesterase